MVQTNLSNEFPTLPSSVAAHYIGMSESWLRQSRMLGRSDGPPFLRLGSRAVRYLRVDLDRWLEQRRCSGMQAQIDPPVQQLLARTAHGLRHRRTQLKPKPQKRKRRPVS